jgi:hypothetical protein
MIYIKDPIGKIYYSDPSEYHCYRENIGESAWDYQRVKSYFISSVARLNESQNPSFDLFINDKCECIEPLNYDVEIETIEVPASLRELVIEQP